MSSNTSSVELPFVASLETVPRGKIVVGMPVATPINPSTSDPNHPLVTKVFSRQGEFPLVVLLRAVEELEEESEESESDGGAFVRV